MDSNAISLNERLAKEFSTTQKLLDFHDEGLKANNLKVLEINVIKKEMAQLNIDKASKFDQNDLYLKIGKEFVSNMQFTEMQTQMFQDGKQNDHELEKKDN